MTETPGLDVAGLTGWLQRAHPDLAGGDLEAHVIAGGKSNLTYRIDGARIPLVLRRPPLGHVLASAHDMHREHRVISALRDSAVPVPRAVDFVDDTAAAEVTGTPFFVMEFVDGHRARLAPARTRSSPPTACARVSLELAEILAELHAVDAAARRARRLRSRRRLPGPPAAHLAPAVRRVALAGPPDARPRCRTASASACPTPHGPRSCTATTGSTTRSSSGRAIPRGSRRSSTGRCPRSATRSSISACSACTGTSAHSRAPRARSPSAIDPAAGYPSFGELVDAYAARAGIGVPDLSLVRRVRGLQARRDRRGHPLPLQPRRDRRRRLRSHRRARRADRRRGTRQLAREGADMDFAHDDAHDRADRRGARVPRRAGAFRPNPCSTAQLAATPDEWGARPIVRELQATRPRARPVEPLPPRRPTARA